MVSSEARELIVAGVESVSEFVILFLILFFIYTNTIPFGEGVIAFMLWLIWVAMHGIRRSSKQ